MKICYRNITAVVWCLMLISAAVHADQVQLNVSMGNPVLLADRKQITYLKVGLTGFEFSRSKQRAPVNVAIVVDRSGSMSGSKIQRAKDAAIMAVNRLQSRDIISVVTYESTVRVLVPATKISDRSWVINTIRQIEAGGSTALYAGVSKGVHEVRKFFDKNRVNRVILLSDGLANVGPSTPAELGVFGSALGEEGISVTTIGIGTGYNEDLMTQLAKKSGGNHGFAETANDLLTIFNYEFSDVLSVVAQEVMIQINCATGIRPIKTMGRDSQIVGPKVVVGIHQLYSKQEKYVLLELEVPATENGKIRDIATVQVSYANMATKTADNLSSKVAVRFSDSEKIVKQSTNEKVAIAAITQIANENNKKALELRDKGDIEGAKQVLRENVKFLDEELAKYDSEVLERLKTANDSDIQNLSPEKWNKNRKKMRKIQYEMETSQDW